MYQCIVNKCSTTIHARQCQHTTAPLAGLIVNIKFVFVVSFSLLIFRILESKKIRPSTALDSKVLKIRLIHLGPTEKATTLQEVPRLIFGQIPCFKTSQCSRDFFFIYYYHRDSKVNPQMMGKEEITNLFDMDCHFWVLNLKVTNCAQKSDMLKC